MGAKNIYRAKVLKNEESSQRLILGFNGLQFSIPTSLSQDKMEVGKEVDLFIRPEEVMILREDKPIKDSLKRNVFEGELLDISDKER